MRKTRPDQVDYVNAHATSTGLGDIAETRALKTVFGERAKSVSISATKSMTGHLLGGAGAVEMAACALAIRDSVIPPTINLDNPDEQCDLDYTPKVAKEKKVRIASTIRSASAATTPPSWRRSLQGRSCRGACAKHLTKKTGAWHKRLYISKCRSAPQGLRRSLIITIRRFTSLPSIPIAEGTFRIRMHEHLSVLLRRGEARDAVGQDRLRILAQWV